jgi:autoinducer 2-degrading protein
VKPFIQATLQNANGTRKEPGNVRFDVLQVQDQPTQFLLYEAYHTKEDFAKHQQTPHYFAWKDTVTNFMSQPRQGVKHQSIFFGDSANAVV